jgi:hypothetical protein
MASKAVAKKMKNEKWRMENGKCETRDNVWPHTELECDTGWVTMTQTGG